MLVTDRHINSQQVSAIILSIYMTAESTVFAENCILKAFYHIIILLCYLSRFSQLLVLVVYFDVDCFLLAVTLDTVVTFFIHICKERQINEMIQIQKKLMI